MTSTSLVEQRKTDDCGDTENHEVCTSKDKDANQSTDLAELTGACFCTAIFHTGMHLKRGSKQLFVQ